MDNKILLISAHPDDETSCLGTLLKLKAKKWQIYQVVLTDAGEGLDKKVTKTQSYAEVAEKRQQEMSIVGKALGMDQIFFMTEEDLNLRYTKELMLKLAKIIRAVKPSRVILMNRHDYHPDHKAAYRLGIAAVRWAASGIRPDFGKPHRVSTTLQMGGMIITRPDFIEDVTSVVDKKIELLKLHGSQASTKMIKFEEASMIYFGYHMRTDGEYGEPFEYCPDFPSIGEND